MYQLPAYTSVAIAVFFIFATLLCAFEIHDAVLRTKINQIRLARHKSAERKSNENPS